jgi:uridine phosphorylase
LTDPIQHLTDPIHIHATAPLAERVLLPGDPGRALALAQSLLCAPKMFNHNRGLWGYTGEAIVDGRPLTIQSTGMGGPSAAIVISELVELGARTFVRVGTCGSLTTGLGVGELVIVTEAICEDGASRALALAERVAPEPVLLARLIAAGQTAEVTQTAEVGQAVAVRQAIAVSTDLFYDRPAGERDRWAGLGAAVVELETATVLALARRRGLSAAALLLVADVIGADGRRHRIAPEQLRAGEQRLGELAVRALSA